MDSRPLQVTGVRMFPVEDGAKHHTDKFQVPPSTSVLRRGEVFHLIVNFASSFNPEDHRILLEFHTGREFRRLETTSDFLQVQEPNDLEKWPPGPAEWGARRMGVKHERAVAIKVSSPSWLPIGKWTLDVRTELVRIRDYHAFSSVFNYPGHIYFLFNPWNPEDDTYMNDTNLLQEYVLSDIGNVWTTTNMRTGPFAIWDYGQFEEIVLPTLEMVIEKDGLLKPHRRGNVMEVSRAISRIVNSTRGGIIVGNWSTDLAGYAGGKHPSYWTNSHEIIQQYLKSGGRPVEFGQCWVFAALTVTFCRAIGLPCRLVTNLSSGHDYDGSLMIDFYYDNRLEKDAHSDTVWNFHAWADAWMRRPDLRQPEYDGWQTIDGTPQELSQGQYQCGPCPVRAIHSGDTQVHYDAPFIFAEVNGDLARWMRTKHRLRLIDVNNNIIGQVLLTDDPELKSSRFKIITDEYKPPEGSAPERKAVLRASSNPHLAKASRRRRELDQHSFINDVDFQDDFPYGIEFGEDFDVAVVMKNKSGEVRTLDGAMIVETVDHRGTPQDIFKTSGKLNITLRPHESQTCRMFVTAREYIPHLTENTSLRLRTKCFVHETEQPWLSDEFSIIEINVPNLQIEFNDDLWMGRPVLMFLSFDRAVNLPLTGCRIRLGGSGLERGGGVLHVDDIAAGVRFFQRIRIYPARPGVQKITVKFTSRELPKVEAWIELNVLRGGGTSRSLLNFGDHEDNILEGALHDDVVD